MALLMNKAHEWLEADGLGGFASGTSLGVRTRRYHALLLASASPPTERFALVNGVDSWIQDGSERHALTRHRYKGETPVAPSAEQRFEPAPWPRWTTRLPSGGEIVHELFVPKGAPAAVLTWRLLPSHASSPVRLRVRPLMSGRDYHALHHVNPRFDFVPTRLGSVLRWQVYTGVPAVMAVSNGAYEHAPDWYYRFYYEQEHERGFDALEDLASPGVFEFDLTKGEAVLILAADTPGLPADLATCEPSEWMRRARVAEHTRRSVLGGSLERAADAYIVKRDNAATIIAGYPWFADWGRDTFIALRGLCIATGRLVEARSILLRWAGEVSEGMLPNRFPDDGGEPEFNSVDASLWFVIAAHELIEAADACPGVLNAEDRRTLLRAVDAIVSGYASGTRFGIRMDNDGLLAAGKYGLQLTWMDARVNGRVVTPRIGKPVEVQALWVNALWIASLHDEKWRDPHERAARSLRMDFWNESRGCLYDVIDVDHERGARDPVIRPNQLFAIGGLPQSILDPVRARRVLETVERELLTPMGLRSLAPGELGYTPRYQGGPHERDEAYHQGTVWPWLMGAFIEAWVRVHGRADATLEQARDRFFNPWMKHLHEAGLGHVSEIADAEAPHAPRGCPFQAWSVGEAIRIDRSVLPRGAHKLDAVDPHAPSPERAPQTKRSLAC